MKSKSVYILIGLLGLALVGGLFLLITKINPSKETTVQKAGSKIESVEFEEPVETSNTAAEGVQPIKYTMEEVAAHIDEGSCWTVINGSVYDVTSLINTHTGGKESIMETCGVDASQTFNEKHGGQEKVEKSLDTLKIGTVVEQAS